MRRLGGAATLAFVVPFIDKMDPTSAFIFGLLGRLAENHLACFITSRKILA
jgi:hypothetical protein